MNVITKKSQAGFSLVELMVVVAIIGILASLAIPSVGKYMAKARQSEAKTQLSSLYTAQKAFYAEYTAYDERFQAVGYSPEGKLRYNVGFTAGGFTAGPGNGYNAPAGISAVSNTGAYCGAAGVINASGCAMLNGATNAAPPGLVAAACPATPTVAAAGCATQAVRFLAGASAVIHAAGATDSWEMDSAKEIRNSQIGIP